MNCLQSSKQNLLLILIIVLFVVIHQKQHNKQHETFNAPPDCSVFNEGQCDMKNYCHFNKRHHECKNNVK